MVNQAVERIVRFLETLPEQPMHTTTGGKKLAFSLREDLMPEQGESYEKLLAFLFQSVLPASLNTASPGYLAYVPGGGLVHSAIADLITDTTNRYISVFIAAPGLVQLEANVVAWFANMLGMPEKAGGILTTGGSMATLIAVVTARRNKLPPEFSRGVLYTSSEAHQSVQKAALFAGLLPENIRQLPVDEHFRMVPSVVEAAIVHDKEQGKLPFLLVPSAGTVGTGVVDDLEALADVAHKHGLWMHVDGAYGGFFALTQRGRHAMRGIERADSVTLDPHKGLFLPYGTGSLVVRDRELLRKTFAVTASYMPPMQAEEAFVDFCDFGPELSRDVRGLRVWLPLKMHGKGVFRAALDEKLDLARQAAAWIEQLPDVQLVSKPTLSLFAFRVVPKEGTEEENNQLNRRWMASINRKQRVLLTGTMVGSLFVIRMCVLCFRTHEDRMLAAFEDIKQSLCEVRSKVQPLDDAPGPFDVH
jgi:aromatic-L-amino-acid/L-tryptophan decarboxylase